MNIYFLLKYFKQLKLKQEQNKKWVFSNSYNKEYYICCKVDGNPLGLDYVSQTLKKLLEDNKMPHIRFHDFADYVELYIKGTVMQVTC